MVLRHEHDHLSSHLASFLLLKIVLLLLFSFIFFHLAFSLSFYSLLLLYTFSSPLFTSLLSSCAPLSLVSTFHLLTTSPLCSPSVFTDPLSISSLPLSFLFSPLVLPLLYSTCSCITYISPQKFRVKCPLSLSHTHTHANTHTCTHRPVHMKEQWTWNTNDMTNRPAYTTYTTHTHTHTHTPIHTHTHTYIP